MTDDQIPMTNAKADVLWDRRLDEVPERNGIALSLPFFHWSLGIGH